MIPPYLFSLLLLVTLSLPPALVADDETQAPPSTPAMSTTDAIILGIVEGLTEYLPVSSTGHLLLTQRALGIGSSPEQKQAADSFAIVIQCGAILAVMSIYWQYILSLFLGLVGKSDAGRRLFINLIAAFLPAAVIGLLFVDMIRAHIFNLWAVSFAWLIGGIALIAFRSKGKYSEGSALEDLTPKQALCIGLLQCVAMWPGTSRSLVTILGGRWAGLSVQSAVSFSFLLGVVTLSASTVYDVAKHGQEMTQSFGLSNLLIGVFTGWISALLAVKWMVHYLQKHGLALFGFYRVALGLITGALLITGVLAA